MICKIESIINNVLFITDGISLCRFNIKFGVLVNYDGVVKISPLSDTLIDNLNFFTGFNNILSMGVTHTFINNFMTVYIEPNVNGTNNYPINISGDVNLQFSDSYKDNIMIYFD